MEKYASPETFTVAGLTLPVQSSIFAPVLRSCKVGTPLATEAKNELALRGIALALVPLGRALLLMTVDEVIAPLA